MPVDIKTGESEQEFISRCIGEEISSGKELWARKLVRSSANKMARARIKAKARSLINIRNKVGPRIDPWGTPMGCFVREVDETP